MYRSSQKLIILSGIYPPDNGGPARFSVTFPMWLKKEKNISTNVISLTDSVSSNTSLSHGEIFLTSRNRCKFLRIMTTFFQILKNSGKNRVFLVNGLFLECYLASCVLPNFEYVAKIPGDVVWERSRNSGRTKLNIQQFQGAKLNLIDRFYRYIFSKALQRARKVVTPSLELKELCLKWGVNEKKIAYIGNAADQDHFQIIKQPKYFDLLCVSRLVSWKNIDTVIKTAKKLDLRLGVAGDGNERIKLQELANNLDAKVSFLKSVPYQELPKIYNQTDILILISDYEGMPYSLIEAQLCGVFCIANGSTGSKDVIKDSVTGFLIESPDASTLERAIIKFYDKKMSIEDRQNIRSLAIRDFSFSANFEKLYREIF